MSGRYPLPPDVVGRILPKLTRAALCLVDQHEAEAEDLVQRVFAKMDSLLERYDGPPPPWDGEDAGRNERQLLGFLCRCLSGELANDRRKKARRRDLLARYVQLGTPSADGHAGALARVEVEQVLSAATEEDADLLVRRFILDTPYAEIAATEGISESAVRARVCRALTRLRKRLQQHE